MIIKKNPGNRTELEFSTKNPCFISLIHDKLNIAFIKVNTILSSVSFPFLFISVDSDCNSLGYICILRLFKRERES